MQDLRALQWLEALTSREHVLALITEVAGMPISNTDYPHDPAFFIRLRNHVDNEIENLRKEDNS